MLCILRDSPLSAIADRSQGGNKYKNFSRFISDIQIFEYTERKRERRMKYVVCFSGGHSSALAAVETVIRHGKRSTILLNHDISSKVEDADVKRFKQEVADYLDLPIVYANREDFQTQTPLSLCREMKMFRFRAGNSICTYYLKTEPFYRWLKENYPVRPGELSEEITLVYGFDEWEPQRVERRKGHLLHQGYRSEYPLAEGGNNRQLEDIRDIGIKLPATYRMSKHANCKGCLKAGKQHWYMVYCLWPEVFFEAMETERIIGCSIIKGYFLADLEPLFDCMNNVGILPNDNECSAVFWARAKKRLGYGN